jgi:glutamate dehydrogenase
MDGAQFDAFVSRFFDRAAPEDLEAVSRASQRQLAHHFWVEGRARPGGKPYLRVFTPELEHDGWTLGATLIAAINDDKPFLVDSVVGALKDLGVRIYAVFHPILRASRDSNGLHRAFLFDGAGQGMPESMIAISIARVGEAKAREIETTLQAVFADVGIAVADWKTMLMRLSQSITELRMRPPRAKAEEIAESIAFLEWLEKNHFTFLGCRDYVFDPQGDGRLTPLMDSGLGLLRDPDRRVIRRGNDRASLTPEVRGFLVQPSPLIITKSNVRSTVHRRVQQDYVGVKRYDAFGALTGERRFVGLFTSEAYNAAAEQIPFIGRKVASVIVRANLPKSSHDAKALTQVLESYPRDELFQISEDDLLRIALGRVYLGDRPRTKAFIRFDTFDRFVSALIYVPTERFRGRLLRDLSRIVAESFDGDASSATAQNEEGQLTRIHILADRREGSRPAISEEQLQTSIDAAVRSWADDFAVYLSDAYTADRVDPLLERYADAFTEGYREAYEPAEAVTDVARIEDLLKDTQEDPIALRTWRDGRDGPGQVRFKIYRKGPVIELSDILPVLENFGLRVQEETSHPVTVPAEGLARRVTVHQFRLKTQEGVIFDEAREAPLFEEAFLSVWRGATENDGFNRLTMSAGVKCEFVTVLRAIAKFLRQAAFAASQSLIEEALSRQPALTSLLVRLYRCRLDPEFSSDSATRERMEADISNDIEKELAGVQSIDDDRIIRRYANILQAMLRTNAFQGAKQGIAKPAMSFKFDSQKIDDLPLPRPMVEIFVYSPEVEGVHLRFGRVARGGIRWSDRREDFRTEILGLVKAQQVKNAVIVPGGSKGGFFPKKLPPASAGREAVQAAAVAAYKTFIGSLLDITDNLDASGNILPPASVVRRDGDDPYLVVAADKGTATFSDIANGIARDYGFWLDDAFASGGSAGYDHKKMGITARGAWEAVKRHFREIGHDIQADPFTAVGVGDMSGDVFGNGMLLSRQTRLLAAFDHRDIFLDPDPDPARSFAERQRMFDLPRSSWNDYDNSKISAGGGVFSRSMKRVPLSSQVQALLGVGDREMEPGALIQLLLKMPVDLLWFGGIGTFIKASSETHAQAGDRANDALRVDANQLRAKVVGEGANLGLTQAGRIEFARAGGHINTDAIDNSAGVDTSDHEVNLKILLNSAMARGEMKLADRDAFLAKLTDEVAALVLKDNYQQSQALSVAQWTASEDIEAHGRMMRALEKSGRLNRKVEGLPGDESLKSLGAQGQGLTRPELAILLAYAKLELFDELDASGFLDDPYLEKLLVEYFPSEIAVNFGEAMRTHRLRREIIGTVLTNELINLCGPAFMQRMRETSGASSASIARAAIVAANVFSLEALARRIESLDGKVTASQQIAMLARIVPHMQRQSFWFIRNLDTKTSIVAAIADYKAGVEQLRGTFSTLVSAAEAREIETAISAMTVEKVPLDIAEDVAALAAMAAVPDIVRLSRARAADLDLVAGAFFAAGRLIGADRLRLGADKLQPTEHWDRLAVRRVADDLFQCQYLVAAAALRLTSNDKGRALGVAAVDAWGERNRPGVQSLEALLAELDRLGAYSIARLTLAAAQIRDLVSAGAA